MIQLYVLAVVGAVPARLQVPRDAANCVLVSLQVVHCFSDLKAPCSNGKDEQFYFQNTKVTSVLS